MKTSDLIGAQLDWAVAKCENIYGLVLRGGYLRYPPAQFSDEETYSPSTDWAQGGVIVEGERINLSAPYMRVDGSFDTLWYGRTERGAGLGPTPLIAAMRCLVASKLGDEVDIPKELRS